MPIDNTRPSEGERLRHLYHSAGMSEREIASALNTTRYQIRKALDEHDIERRASRKEKATLRIDDSGYAVWWATDGTCRVHQLLAIADGVSPADVFHKDTVVHHSNGIPWDNRRENLELMTRSEHTEYHYENGDIESPVVREKYTDDELLSWIDAYVFEFDVVPVTSDIREWPGPSPPVYRERFGSIAGAVERAGFEPRGES